MTVTEEKTIASEIRTDPVSVRRICFVCTGNTCRSPMAAAVVNAFATEEAQKKGRLFPDLVAESRGICAYNGEPISEGAARALESLEIRPVAGLDYHDHRARKLTEEDLERYDLFVALSEGHVTNLMMRFPQATPKIIRMPRSIPDPYDEEDVFYRKCLEEIIRGVSTLFFPERAQ